VRWILAFLGLSLACADAPSRPSVIVQAPSLPQQNAVLLAREGIAAIEPRQSPLGSDLSDLPRRFPAGDWLTIDAPLFSMQVVVPVGINDQGATATLDTGAMGTTMSLPLAQSLGIVDERTPPGESVYAVDAHGNRILGEKIRVASVRVGRHTWTNVKVTLLGEQSDLFLIGADLLQDKDLYLAADEGLVGIFDAGTGPKDASDLVIGAERGDRQLLVNGVAKGGGGAVSFQLIVDTGAWNTSIPTIAGVNGGLTTDVGFESTTLAVGGEETHRGRFVLDPLLLGDTGIAVGRVLAMPSNLRTDHDLGLLGNDVLMRSHVVVSFHDSALRIKKPTLRPPHRQRGPGGATCDGPCIRVGLETPPADMTTDDSDMKDVCLRVHVGKAYAQQTLELAITPHGDDALFNGGAIRAFVTTDQSGASTCFRLWRQLQRLGFSKDTPLSLRWMRTEGVRWPCDPMKTRCITFTGPLAKLGAKNG
jgi:hypothetical protein